MSEGDPNDGKSWAWALKEMRELWEWWTVTRPAKLLEEQNALMAWYESKGATGLWQKYDKLEESIAADDEANLIRLMKVRRYLWT